MVLSAIKASLNQGRAVSLLLGLVPAVNAASQQLKTYRDNDGELNYLEYALVAARLFARIAPLVGFNEESTAKYLEIVKTGYETLNAQVDEVQSHLEAVDGELTSLYQRYGVDANDSLR